MKTKARKKGAGTLVLRGKIFEARWTVDGRTFSRSTGESNRRDAERRLAEFVAPFQLKQDAARDAAAATSAGAAGCAAAASALSASARIKADAHRNATALPLADAWRAFDDSLFHRDWARTTHDLNESRVSAFLAWMGRNRPEVKSARDVSPDDAGAFLREIRKAHSGKTFNDYRAILLQTWDGLRKIEAAAVTENPFRSIERAERRSHTRRELTVEELAAVIAATDGEMRLLFAVGIYTGLRLGDAVRLDWGDVDLVRGFLSVMPSKTARHGTRVKIPLSPVLRSLLLETPALRRRGPVMPEFAALYSNRDYGNEDGRLKLMRWIQAVFRKAGIETQTDTAQRNKDGTPRKAVDVGFHSLRHTYVSLCANAGVPLAVVQSIVGHTNPAMTRHYFHESDAALRSAADALPDVRAAAAPVAALPAPVASVETALDALRAAVRALVSANPSPAQWDEAAAILADARKAGGLGA